MQFISNLDFGCKFVHGDLKNIPQIISVMYEQGIETTNISRSSAMHLLAQETHVTIVSMLTYGLNSTIYIFLYSVHCIQIYIYIYHRFVLTTK